MPPYVEGINVYLCFVDYYNNTYIVCEMRKIMEKYILFVWEIKNSEMWIVIFRKMNVIESMAKNLYKI